MTGVSGRAAGFAALMAAAMATSIVPALAQDGNRAQAQSAANPPEDDTLHSIGSGAGRIATQPVKDVGLSKTDIPPVLVTAAADPYALEGARTCVQIAEQVRALNAALGPDYAPDGPQAKENRAGKLAEAGGQTIVNSLIPFRGLVREVSGAASAQRQMNAAVDAGLARRGFLRGLHSARRCKTTF